MNRRLLALLVLAGLPALASSQEADHRQGSADKHQRGRVERRAERQARNKTDGESSDARRKAEARSQDRQARVQSRAGTQDVGERVARAQRDARTDDGAQRTATGGPQLPPKGETQDTARTQRDKEQEEPVRDRESGLKPPVEGVRQTDRPADRPPQDRSETDAPKLPEREDARRQPTAQVADRAELPKKLELEERKHRERLAKIARLRALALEKNQTERLRALEELERKENERFQRYRDEARASLGDRDFDEVDRRLSHGRGHGQAHDVRPHDAKGDKADKDKDAERHTDGERRQDVERRPEDKRPEDKPKKDKP
jgi:hypothetical protein